MDFGANKPGDPTRDEQRRTTYSHDVESLMRSLRATLTNLDGEHELEVAKLGRSTAPTSVKTRVLAGIIQRHQERRAPYARGLVKLQQRLQT